MAIRTDRYFAAAPPSEIGESLINRFVQEAESKTGFGGMYALAYSHYYGHEMGSGVTSRILRGGEQGELAAIRINKARSLAKSLHSLITGPNATWRATAVSNDVGSKAATILAHNLLEFYWKKRQMSLACAVMGEMGIAFAEGFVFSPWDETIGPEVAPDPTTQKMIRAGDVAFHNTLPWDVVRDSGAKSPQDTQWKAVRLWPNKWDLIAMRPTDILGQPTRDAILAASKDDGAVGATPHLQYMKGETDRVPVWYFYHDRTPALPQGLEVILVSAKCVLRRKPLSYKRIPLTRFGLDELLGTPFGYTSWWDTLAIQELTDGLESAIATNQLTLAVQAIGVEQGTESPVDNAFGMKEFVYPRGGKPPTAIQLTSSPAEVFNHIKDKARDQQSLLNLNDVQRGQPDTAQMNAQAFMVLASKAVEQNAPGQKAWLAAVSDLGTHTLEIVADRVTEDRKIAITGKGQKYLFTEQSFKGEQLKPIESAYVEIGNPLEQSAGGRYQLATAHHEMGLIKTVEDLQQVLDTGRLEPAIQDIRDESMHIASENEDLATGKPVLCHALHNHLRHAPKHAAVLFNPETMRNPKAMKAVEDHVHQHYVEFFMLEGEPMLDPMGNPIPGAEPMPPDPFKDPQYPIRIRMLLGQQPPPDMVPPPMDGTMPPAPGEASSTGPMPEMLPPGGPPPGLPEQQPPQPPPPPAMGAGLPI